MEELVKYIIDHLVSDKDAVKVTSEESGENTVNIKIIVADGDMGKVIGKNGKIAQSIRSIVKSASSDSGKRYLVHIGEDK